MTNDLNDSSFQTREEYLEWRAAWRDEYRHISKAIRDCKARMAHLFKNGESAAATQLVCIEYQKTALRMMELRAYSKKIAAARYAERLALSLAA